MRKLGAAYRAGILVAVAACAVFAFFAFCSADPSPRPGKGMRLLKDMPTGGDVVQVAFSHDEKFVLSASAPGTVFGKVIVSDLATGKEVRSFDGGGTGVALSPDGRYLVTGHNLGPLQLYEFASGKLVRAFEPHGGIGYCAAFSPDGKLVVAGGGRIEDKKMAAGAFLRLWDASTGQEIRRLEGHEGPVTRVWFTANGKRILSGSSDGTARLWDAETGKELYSTRPESKAGDLKAGSSFQAIRVPLSLHPDGRRFFHEFKLWELEPWKKLRDYEAPRDSRANCVAFTPDGKRFLTGNDDGTVRIFDFESGKQFTHFEPFVNRAKVYALAVSADGKKLLTAGQGTIPGFDAIQRKVPAVDNYVRLWSLPE